MKTDTPAMARMRAKLLASAGKAADRKHVPNEEPDVRIKAARQRGIDGRKKGAAYELKIAKMLTDWTGDVFRRTPMSGGWSKEESFAVAGDLVSTNKSYPFHHELKKREGWHIDDLITGMRASGELSILEWWSQCVGTCPKGKVPMLIFSRNLLRCDFVLMRREDYYESIGGPKMSTMADIGLPRFDFWIENTHGNPAIAGGVVIFSLQQYLGMVRPPKGCKNHKSWKPQDVPIEELR